MNLREIIAGEIREHGPIPFSRYMELCLYHPQLGYYSRNAQQFGKAGDFYTSSDVHAVFGRLLARQFDEMWRALGSPKTVEVVELGPGRGLFARDVLDWSEKKFPEFFRAVHYRLAESSPALRSRLQETLAHHIAARKASLMDIAVGPAAAKADSSDFAAGTTEVVPSPVHLNSGPSTQPSAIPIGRDAIVFANEFFDALPVEVLSERGELRIEMREGHFVETWAPPSAAELEYLDHYSVHPETWERVEALLLAQQYMQRVAAGVQRGFVIAIDYGYTREELLAGRHRGTVMTYRQQSASPNPFEAPGEQDITAHVNFTALAAAAAQHGMQAHKLLTQSQFLMGIGEQTEFADAFEDCRLPQERAKVALQLKHLVTPAGMGESFQVSVASKGMDATAVSQLCGLRFGH